MRKKQAKTIFIFLVLLVIGSMILSACGSLEGDEFSGAAGGQGKGQGKDENKETGKDETGGSGKTDEVIDDGTENDKGGGKNKKITLCHATGSETNPYVKIAVADDGVYNGHIDHSDDIIPAPAEGCPKPEKKTPTPPPKEKVSLCHATGSEKNPFVFITVADDGAYSGHANHADDVFNVSSAADCPQPPTPTPTATPEPGKVLLCHAIGDGKYELAEVTDSADLDGHAAHADDIYPVPAEGCPTPPPDIPEEPEPETGICVNFIVFHSLREGNLEIYRLNGSENDANPELINLSQGPLSLESRPARSWDDSLVVFESTRSGNIELFINSSGGGTPTQLTETVSNNINPIFLHGDENVLFQSDRNGNWDIFIINLETREERQLTTDLAQEIYPFPSPYPEWITYQSNRNGNWDIFLLNVVTGEEFPFATSAANETLPTWSPDGKSIAYISDENGEPDLWVEDVETNVRLLITEGEGSTANNPSWSPVGRRIAFQDSRENNLDVYTYDLETNTEYRATNYEGLDSAPTWDCSGERVSFTSRRDGDVNIFEVFWQGGTNNYLTNDPAVDKWSQWSPSKEQGSRGQ